MRIVKRHAGGPENQVINFFRPYVMDSKNTVSILEIKALLIYNIYGRVYNVIPMVSSFSLSFSEK